MANKNTDATTLRKLAASNTLIIGTDKTLKELKKGKLEKVLLSSNCKEETKETIKQYCKLSKIQCEELKEDDAEIGIICRKQFSISVAGVAKNR